jgi:hypothetical protein
MIVVLFLNENKSVSVGFFYHFTTLKLSFWLIFII